MTRPGFVLEVDDRTPPLVVHEGEGFRLENFPLGTRVIYPPESLPAIRDVDERDPRRPAPPGRLRPAARATVRRDAAHDRLRRHLAAAAAHAGARHPAADHRAGADDGGRGRRRRRPHRRRQRPAPPDDRRRSSSTSWASGSSGPSTRRGALQPRRRGPRQPAPHRADRPGRGRRDQPPGGRVRPARLRQRQPGGDGRRAQVGADRAGVVQDAAAPPQLEDDGALALLHGPHEVPPAPLRLADGAAAQGPPQHLPDRDHARQRRVPGALRLPAEARVGVVGQGPGLDAGDATRARCRAEAAPAQAVPRPARAVRPDRHQRRRDGGRARADDRRGPPAAARRGAGAVRRAGDGRALPRPLQRQLDDEPDPRDLHGPRLLLQLLPRPAGRTPRRRGDPLPPARSRTSTSCTTRATSTSTRRSWPSRPTRR